MFGDCQGNLCSLDVARIVGRERAIPVSVRREAPSRLLALGGGRPSAGCRRSTEPSEMPGSTDILVIGLGLAGRAAAQAATEAGASVVGVDRRAGATVVGLSPNEDGGWVVLAQSTAGSTEIRDDRRDRRDRRAISSRASIVPSRVAGRPA